MPDDLPFAAELRDAPLADALGERYLAYALSTIMARSLPDVRDGLKPVHRRLLYAMRELRLDPNTAFKKCARIVGDVMGKYHPHGNDSIYDAMVRLAQDFAVRYPLVDGQGNFGNIDGDNPAAMRYTEARLTEVAQRLLEGIDENAVDFRATYDGEGSEPVVLPANFPNLLANGAAGIAVGMATSIPPHNVAEICDALERLIEKEKLKGDKVSIRELVKRMPGPDFPTGGQLVEPFEAIVAAYKTGKGAFRLRATWSEEKTKGGGYLIVVTEIPYQVQKSRLVERIAELLAEKKLPLLADVRDESAEDVRLVLEPKSRNVESAVLMEHLFKQTELEIRVSLNMNVLDRDKTPRVMDLGEVLRAFLDHRREVLLRRSEFRLRKIAERLEILKGYMVAYINLDEVIRIIRSEDEPKPVMMKRFKITEAQAEAILNMRLRQLRRLDEIEIKREIKELTKEQREIKELVGSDRKQWEAVGGQIGEIKKAFGKDTPLGRRRTQRGDAPALEVADIEISAEKEPVTVICSEKGWIRALGGHLENADNLQFKEGDTLRFFLHAQSTDRVLLFGTDGKFYTIPVEKLPRGRGHGEPVRLLAGLGNEHEIVALLVHDAERTLLVAASDGRGFLVRENEVAAQTRAGKQALNLAEGAVARVCVPAVGDHIASLGENRKLLIFPRTELPEMARGRGITLQKFKDGGLSDVKVFALEQGLEVRIGGKSRVYAKPELADWLGQRAQAGRLPPQGFPRSGKF
jgi:topoisomerase-4 subunit A